MNSWNLARTWIVSKFDFVSKWNVVQSKKVAQSKDQLRILPGDFLMKRCFQPFCKCVKIRFNKSLKWRWNLFHFVNMLVKWGWKNTEREREKYRPGSFTLASLNCIELHLQLQTWFEPVDWNEQNSMSTSSRKHRDYVRTTTSTVEKQNDTNL